MPPARRYAPGSHRTRSGSPFLLISGRKATAGAAAKALLDDRRAAGWDLVCLGANQDAITTGARLGFTAESAIDFDANAETVQAVVASTSRPVRAGATAAFTEEERRGASRRRRS